MDQYDVSRITAARALKELANDGYIRRMRKNGSIVISQNMDSTAARLPAHTASPYLNVPFVLPFAPDLGFDIMGGIQKEAQKRNILITMFNSKRLLDKERGIPIIFVDRQLRYLDVPYVASDNFHSMRRLTQWLLDKGHRRIAFVAYDLNAYCENQRFKGYVKAMTDNGLELSSGYIQEVRRMIIGMPMMPENDRATPKFVRDCLQEIISQPEPPTALMCSFDLLASYVEQQASALGISIPGDLSVTGFDNIFLSNHLEVPLTTVAQNYDLIGKKGVELLLALRTGQQVQSQNLVETPIVERSSVRAI